MAIEHHVFHWINTYGYWGLFGLLVFGIVGIPIPDETLLTAVGWYIAATHRLAYIPAFLAAFCGSAVGISLSFFIGKFGGRLIILRFGRLLHITGERIDKMEKLIEKYGRLSIFFGYFIPGIRHLTAIVSGLGQMRYRSFWLPAYTGAALWVVTFLMIGRMFGNNLQHLPLHRLSHVLEPYMQDIKIISICLFVLIVAYQSWYWRRRLSGGSSDRRRDQ